MSSIFIWLIAILLEGVPVFRAVRGGFGKQYKVFYSYLCFVLVRDVCLLGIFFVFPTAYAWSYWSTEVVGVLVGCGVVWETYKVALAPYTGAARMARGVLPVLFIFAVARIVVKAWTGPNWIGRTPLETEIDLRIVQLALLLGLIALFFYYGIPLGRNLKGIVYGYGLFLATTLAELMLRGHFGLQFQNAWRYLEPGSYLTVLLVWCITLWSYAPVSQPSGKAKLEKDYQTLAMATSRKLRTLRVQTWRAIRP